MVMTGKSLVLFVSLPKPRFTAFTIAAAIAMMISLPASRVNASGGDAARGAELFADWNCGDCHTLANACAYGPIGPSLDGNSNLSHDYLVDRITNGGGAMPPFGGQLTDDEIADLADYILAVAE